MLCRCHWHHHPTFSPSEDLLRAVSAVMGSAAKMKIATGPSKKLTSQMQKMPVIAGGDKELEKGRVEVTLIGFDEQLMFMAVAKGHTLFGGLPATR
jgi:hypothetical protein